MAMDSSYGKLEVRQIGDVWWCQTQQVKQRAVVQQWQLMAADGSSKEEGWSGEGSSRGNINRGGIRYSRGAGWESSSRGSGNSSNSSSKGSSRSR